MAILAVELTVVAAANLEAIQYYCQRWGIKEGLDMYRVLGTQYVPNGILSLIQPDGDTGNDIVKGFSQVESNIIKEAKGIINSLEFSKIKAAHVVGESVTVSIGGRIIQYEPGLHASGMTMFGENGLHKLYRLYTSSSAGGVSGEFVAQETKAAFDFAARAIGELFK